MTATRRMPMEDLKALPTVVPLRTAATALGIGQNDCYRQAHAGEFPCSVLRRGRSLVVNRADLFRALGLPPDMGRAPDDGAKAGAA